MVCWARGSGASNAWISTFGCETSMHGLEVMVIRRISDSGLMTVPMLEAPGSSLHVPRRGWLVGGGHGMCGWRRATAFYLGPAPISPFDLLRCSGEQSRKPGRVMLRRHTANLMGITASEMDQGSRQGTNLRTSLHVSICLKMQQTCEARYGHGRGVELGRVRFLGRMSTGSVSARY